MITLCISAIIAGSVLISTDDPVRENLMPFLLIVEDILSNIHLIHFFFLLVLRFCHSLYPAICNKYHFNLLKDTWRDRILFDFAGSKMPSSLKCQIANSKSKCYVCC